MRTALFALSLLVARGVVHAASFEDALADAGAKLVSYARAAVAAAASAPAKGLGAAAAADKSRAPADAPVPHDCVEKGQAKIAEQAKSYGVTYDKASFRLSESDFRRFAAYYWFSVDVTNVNGRTDVFPPLLKPVLTVLMQKPRGEACF